MKKDRQISTSFDKLTTVVLHFCFSKVEELHKSLFSGFFSIDRVQNSLKSAFNSFCDLQSKKLYHSKYEYVEPGFYWNNKQMDNGLVEMISNQLSKSGAQLIILEAAAGYGKTCSTYEIMRTFSEAENLAVTPIFTELAKNRKAALFRYVLLDEIDRKFPQLSSQLVIREIQNGNVPLVIDGFDELISRSNKGMQQESETNDDAQTMLDTIASLFTEDCNTKIVLTSRRSALFTGQIFDEWVSHKLPYCEVTRITIEEPSVKDWLGVEKAEILEQQRIPFGSIVNPILLAYMRSMEIETFKQQCENVESVIDNYFSSLLIREQERQALLLEKEEQYAIIKEIAKNFVQFEIESEEMQFVRDLFVDAIDEKFQEYANRYYLNVVEKPTKEEFATKLANHALLDRISPSKNQIGFINNFVFGIFVGELFISNPELVNDALEKHIDIASTSYASRDENKRSQLLKALLPHLPRLSVEQQLRIELNLSGTIQQNYTDHFFANYTFGAEVEFDGIHQFKDCIFKNCTFSKCLVTTSAFRNCKFYDCKFYNVVVIRDTKTNCHLIFSDNCVGNELWMAEASYEVNPLYQK